MIRASEPTRIVPGSLLALGRRTPILHFEKPTKAVSASALRPVPGCAT
jgi:hypothetical protein